MSDPNTIKQILESAKKQIEEWPEWMKNQEPTLRVLSPPGAVSDNEPAKASANSIQCK